jgi:hypothetical protein
MNLLAPPKRNLSGAWPENTNPLGTERRGGEGFSVTRAKQRARTADPRRREREMTASPDGRRRRRATVASPRDPRQGSGGRSRNGWFPIGAGRRAGPR